MKTLYIDCGMGAAGDMLTAALLDTLSEKNRQEFVNKINELKIPGLSFSCQPSVKCGITGSHVTVMINGEEELSLDYDDHHHDHDHDHHHDHDHDHHHDHDHDHHHDHDHDHHHDHDHDHEHNHNHSHDDHGHFHSDLKTISEIVDSLKVSDKVKTDVKNIYHIIAEAEGHVHGKPVDQIHFHEVGNMDAIVDVTAVCLLMEMIGADCIMASPVHVGSGKVKCAHGILPVPTPATAHILMGVPIYSGEIQGELCTPTGAALLKYFVKDFAPMPIMKTTAIGYGMGNKDFKVANCVRVLVGETEDENDTILNLSCNVDDMTPEALGFAMEQIFDAGAADVFIMPVTMKKCRPGHVINVIARPELKAQIIEAIMKHTSTIGIRETVCKRNILKREFEEVKTPLGTVRKKISTGYGVTREKYEYEDIAKIARENGMSISEVEKIVSSCE